MMTIQECLNGIFVILLFFLSGKFVKFIAEMWDESDRLKDKKLNDLIDRKIKENIKK